MKLLGGFCAVAMGVLALAGPAAAQENLDAGKSPAQLYASDCAICHKTPQGLAAKGGVLGLDNYLREHYTASRESATAIANYLKSVGGGPAGAAGAKTGAKRSPKGDAAKGDEKPKSGAEKPTEKSTDQKPGEGKAGEGKAGEGKSGDTKSGDTKSGGGKSGGGKSGAAAAPKPADAGKSD